MFSTTARTTPVDPYSRSEHLGILITRGGAVTIDQYFLTEEDILAGSHGELSKFLVCGTAGNIVFEFQDHQYGYYPAASAGQLLPIGAIRVVTSHLFPAVGLLTTTATGLWWFGGA